MATGRLDYLVDSFTTSTASFPTVQRAEAGDLGAALVHRPTDPFHFCKGPTHLLVMGVLRIRGDVALGSRDL